MERGISEPPAERKRRATCAVDRAVREREGIDARSGERAIIHCIG